MSLHGNDPPPVPPVCPKIDRCRQRYALYYP